jgi:hypothetical protein
MTVFELIEKLKQCPQDAIVEFECDDDWYNGEITGCRVDSHEDHWGKTAVILTNE